MQTLAMDRDASNTLDKSDAGYLCESLLASRIRGPLTKFRYLGKDLVGCLPQNLCYRLSTAKHGVAAGHTVSSLHVLNTSLALVADLVRSLRLMLRFRAQLAAENLFLRKQLACYIER